MHASNLLTTVKVHEDHWLSGVMGQSAFVLDRCAGDPAVPASHKGPSDVLRHVAGQTTAFYYAKVDTTDVGFLSRLSTTGLYVVDVNLTLSTTGGDQAIGPSSDNSIAEVTPEQHQEVLNLAGSCFSYTRFHLDPLIPVTLAHSIKREWIRTYLRGERGDRLLVATIEGVVAGFLAVRLTGPAARPVVVIDLMGTHPSYRRIGIGRSLIRHLMLVYKARVESFQVGTQISNVAAFRLYQQCGFGLLASKYVMHMHVRSGKIVGVTS